MNFATWWILLQLLRYVHLIFSRKGGLQMAGRSNLDALSDKLMAISKEEVREPDIPVNYSIEEALTLQGLAMKDKKELLIRKIDWQLVEGLRQRVLAYQEADTLYMVAQFGTGELAEKWKKAYNEAIAVREELVHGMLYAFDGNELLLDAVHSIMQGSSYSDLAHDHSELEGIGIKYKDLLDANGIDFKLVLRAGELKTILLDLLAQTNVEKMEKSPEKQMRDRAFTYMAQAVEKIRKCGKSVFWKDAQHVAHYASAYLRKQRKKLEKSKNVKKAGEKETVNA
jgi:hypothetical protein